jgi:hypothetical protein
MEGTYRTPTHDGHSAAPAFSDPHAITRTRTRDPRPDLEADAALWAELLAVAHELHPFSPKKSNATGGSGRVHPVDVAATKRVGSAPSLGGGQRRGRAEPWVSGEHVSSGKSGSPCLP